MLPSHVLPAWSTKPLKLYLSTYNDPLGGGKSVPGGWFGGLLVCEVLLQLPYFVWALTLPVGNNLPSIALNIPGDKRLELPSLAYSVHASTAILAAICELFAFPETILSQSERITLGAMYIPFQLVLAVMAVDMYKRVRRRLDGIKQD